MKIQLITELGSDGVTLWYNVWKVKDSGEKMSCVECCQSLPEGEKAFNNAIEKLKKVENFKSQILKEMEIPENL